MEIIKKIQQRFFTLMRLHVRKEREQFQHFSEKLQENLFELKFGNRIKKISSELLRSEVWQQDQKTSSKLLRSEVWQQVEAQQKALKEGENREM